ncbi:MAG: MerR family transcriptional regulator [Rickettsiales bacterium]|nr:MerR family transcriptional regulator [Rickettsiales bacterium]
MTDVTPLDAFGGKAHGAMKTISEVAEILELPTHVLRFWETKFPQIQPLKRAGGRRFYRNEDVEALLLIRELLHSRGFTIKGAVKVLPDMLKARRSGLEIPAPNDDFASAPSATQRDVYVEPLPASQREALLILRQELQSLHRLLGS